MVDRTQAFNITDALVELSFLIQATLSRVAGDYELSLTQVRLLGMLRDREPGIVELANALNLDKSSVSGLVARAERRGLVERHATQGADARAIRVVLTEHGRAMAGEFAARVSTQIADLVEDLTPSQRNRLAALATEVVSASGMARVLEAPRR